MQKICVMGLGYIGLPTASLLATKGYIVHGVDVNREAVGIINNGGIQIHEPDLDIMVKAAVQSGNLHAAVEPDEADVFIIAVPTPFKDEHVPDITYVEQAARAIAPCLKSGNLIILESTSPVKTTENIADWLKELRPDLHIPERDIYGLNTLKESADRIYIAHSPERVLPGQILKELVENDRVIGGIDQASAAIAGEFYRSFVKGEIKLTDSRTAELCKLTENAFRDVNIAFANELSLISDQLDINVWQLIELANRHPRVSILQPGPGVGGHCIAVDPWFIVDSVPEQTRLIRTAREINDSKPDFVLEKVCCKASRFKEPVIACLGLSFKADIDDLRESPALEIVKKIAEKELGRILVVEPHIKSLPERLREHPGIELVDLGRALQEADLIVLLVNHRVFADVNREVLKEKVIIDTRGIWK
ncbi:MAG: UDP-N-acetyl-D-mannosamine dehydrogenase [Syntrophomonas sp.]